MQKPEAPIIQRLTSRTPPVVLTLNEPHSNDPDRPSAGRELADTTRAELVLSVCTDPTVEVAFDVALRLLHCW
jgi:hypothetical protein